METVVLGIDTKKFHKDFERIDRDVKSLMSLNIIVEDDIGLIQERIWNIIPKYISTKVA